MTQNHSELVERVARGLRAGHEFINGLPLTDGASRRAKDREFVTVTLIPDGLLALDRLEEQYGTLRDAADKLAASVGELIECPNVDAPYHSGCSFCAAGPVMDATEALRLYRVLFPAALTDEELENASWWISHDGKSKVRPAPDLRDDDYEPPEVDNWRPGDHRPKETA